MTLRGSHLSGGHFQCCGCDCDDGDGGGDGFVPSDISGLFLDLNPAVGTTVNGSNELQAWADQGTSGSDVVVDTSPFAGEPFILTPAAIGGLPGLVSHPENGSTLVSANSAPVFPPGSARTVFVVARPLQADRGCIFISFQPSNGLSTTFALGLWNFGDSGTLYPYTDGIAVSQATPLGPGAYENETKVFAYRFDGSGNIEWSVNGGAFVALTGSAFASETGEDGFYIGRFIGTSHQGSYKGTLGRILGYNTALSDEDAQRVSAFLLAGYGIAGAIVADDISDSGATGRDLIRSATAAAARTVLGATAAGASMLTAANAAAQRALLGIEYEIIDDAPLVAATGYTSPPWAAGRYRAIKIEYRGRVSSGTPATGYVWIRPNNDSGANYEFIADNINTSPSVQGGLLGTPTFAPVAYFNNSQASNLAFWCDLNVETNGFGRVGRSKSAALWNGITLAGSQKWDGAIMWGDIASDMIGFTLGLETDSTLTGNLLVTGYF